MNKYLSQTWHCPPPQKRIRQKDSTQLFLNFKNGMCSGSWCITLIRNWKLQGTIFCGRYVANTISKFNIRSIYTSLNQIWTISGFSSWDIAQRRYSKTKTYLLVVTLNITSKSPKSTGVGEVPIYTPELNMNKIGQIFLEISRKQDFLTQKHISS